MTLLKLDVTVCDAKSQVGKTCLLGNVVPFFALDRRVKSKTVWEYSVLLEFVVEVQVVLKSCNRKHFPFEVPR